MSSTPTARQKQPAWRGFRSAIACAMTAAIAAVGATPVAAQDFETVRSGQTKAVIAHGHCRQVTNGFEDSISIPLATFDEWMGRDGFVVNTASLPNITIRRCAENTNWWDAAICRTTDPGGHMFGYDTDGCKMAYRPDFRVLQQSQFLPVTTADGALWEESFEWQEARPGQTPPARMVAACTRSGRALSARVWGSGDPFGPALQNMITNYQVPAGHVWCIVRVENYGSHASSGGHESTGASLTYIRLWRQ